MADPTVLSTMSDDARRALAEFEMAISMYGPCVVEAKKTTLHFRPGDGAKKSAAFAGAWPLRSGLRLTLVLAEPPHSPRVVKLDQVSTSRWHVELVLLADELIDAELHAWLGAAYRLQTARR